MLVLASDHAGFELKEKLKKYFSKKNIEFFDVGALEYDANDSYVMYGKNAIDYYIKNCDISKDRLILVCGSGIGMSIVANRNKDIRAVLCANAKQAVQAREHNDCNCLCIGARNTCFCSAKKIINKFMAVQFLAGKHLERIKSI